MSILTESDHMGNKCGTVVYTTVGQSETPNHKVKAIIVVR